MLGLKLGGGTASEYLIINMETGATIGSGSCEGYAHASFPEPTSAIALLVYRASEVESKLFASNIEDCPAEADESGDGCDVTEASCTLHNRMLPVTFQMCPTMNGMYLPPNGGGSSYSVSVTSATTTSHSTTTGSTKSIEFTQGAGANLGVANYKSSVTAAGSTMESTTDSISSSTASTTELTIAAGYALTISWQVKTCCYECVVGYLDFAPYGGVVAVTESSCEPLIGSLGFSVQQCDKFNNLRGANEVVEPCP